MSEAWLALCESPTKMGDGRDHRMVNNVCSVVQAPETNFENSNINVEPLKGLWHVQGRKLSQTDSSGGRTN